MIQRLHIPRRVPGSRATVWVGLGGNQGDRLLHLRRAVLALALHPEIQVLAWSRVYETDFVGQGTQDPYLNACCALRTDLAPEVLLSVLKGVEERHGRRPAGHMLPRPLDLDILLWEGQRRDSERLTIPHPRLGERAFALVPLADIAPLAIFPDSGETIASRCAKIRRKSKDGIHELRDGQGNAVPLVPPEGSPDGPLKEEWRAALAIHCR